MTARISSKTISSSEATDVSSKDGSGSRLISGKSSGILSAYDSRESNEGIPLLNAPMLIDALSRGVMQLTSLTSTTTKIDGKG
jgi:hypothetical protein